MNKRFFYIPKILQNAIFSLLKDLGLIAYILSGMDVTLHVIHAHDDVTASVRYGSLTNQLAHHSMYALYQRVFIV